ncbi:MAG: PIN domain-containing protein [Halobacteriota archaeon]
MKFRELYLDTTYIMPFFYLDIDVKGFSRTVYKEVIKSVERIHVSEISIIEAKAKSLKISKKRSEVNEKFNEGLSVLSADEKVVIHGYRAMDDKKFNEFQPLRLGFFDAVILAQSCTVGILLTEDSGLLQLKDVGVKAINWDTLLREMRIGDN